MKSNEKNDELLSVNIDRADSSAPATIEKKAARSDWLNFDVIAVVLTIKVLIFVFAAQSYQIMSNEPLSETGWFWSLFSRWDAENYLKLAESGYASSEANRLRIVFFPLYPGAIALFSVVFQNYVLSALVVSGLASIWLGLGFHQLVRLDYSEKTAQLAVFFLFVFPTSYFLHVPYTESLFLALTVGCFVAARKRNWLLVGSLGALACLTRINGLILIPALLFEVWDEYRATRRVNREWLFFGLIPAGFGGYLALNYSVTGSALTFLTYQRENFHRYFRVPWEGVWDTFNRIFSPKPTDSQMLGMQELTFVLIGLLAVAVGWRYLRRSYWVWTTLNWLLFVSTSFVLSVPRYTLILFPLFILMALAARRDWRLKVFFTVWSILYLSVFLTQFVRGWWAF